MSKIVILQAQLAATTVLNGLLQKLAVKDPVFAQWLGQLDVIPIIKECVDSTLNNLASQDGISLRPDIEDYYGKKSGSHNGMPIIGALKTEKLPKGLGVMVDSQGTIKFAGDDYTDGWRQEINRLQKLFQDEFLQEVINAILQIIGYQTQVEVSTTTNGQKVYQIEGVRQ